MEYGQLDNHIYKIKAGSIFHTLHKSQYKGIKDLEMRPESIKYIEQSVGRTLQVLVLKRVFNSNKVYSLKSE